MGMQGSSDNPEGHSLKRQTRSRTGTLVRRNYNPNPRVAKETGGLTIGNGKKKRKGKSKKKPGKKAKKPEPEVITLVDDNDKSKRKSDETYMDVSELQKVVETEDGYVKLEAIATNIEAEAEATTTNNEETATNIIMEATMTNNEATTTTLLYNSDIDSMEDDTDCRIRENDEKERQKRADKKQAVTYAKNLCEQHCDDDFFVRHEQTLPAYMEHISYNVYFLKTGLFLKPKAVEENEQDHIISLKDGTDLVSFVEKINNDYIDVYYFKVTEKTLYFLSGKKCKVFARALELCLSLHYLMKMFSELPGSSHPFSLLNKSFNAYNKRLVGHNDKKAPQYIYFHSNQVDAENQNKIVKTYGKFKTYLGQQERHKTFRDNILRTYRNVWSDDRLSLEKLDDIFNKFEFLYLIKKEPRYKKSKQVDEALIARWRELRPAPLKYSPAEKECIDRNDLKNHKMLCDWLQNYFNRNISL